jgi:hypothetical protein
VRERLRELARRASDCSVVTRGEMLYGGISGIRGITLK